MDKKKAICEYLRKNHIGKENAIHSKELEKLFVLDGRNIYDGDELQEMGFVYHCIGR